jgi:hypothetical protein
MLAASLPGVTPVSNSVPSRRGDYFVLIRFAPKTYISKRENGLPQLTESVAQMLWHWQTPRIYEILPERWRAKMKYSSGIIALGTASKSLLALRVTRRAATSSFGRI